MRAKTVPGAAAPVAMLAMLLGIAACMDGRVIGGAAPIKSTSAGPERMPMLELSVDRSEVFPGESITIAWKSEGFDRCEANGDWQGSDMGPSGKGTLRVGDTLGAYKYFLTCFGIGETRRADVTVQVVPRQITPIQELEIARAAGVTRAVLDALMLSARYSRSYIESLYAEDGGELKCVDYGRGSVVATPTRRRAATLVASFLDCADHSIRLAYEDASGLRVTLDPSGVGSWRTFGQLHFGDHRFERGRFAINRGNGAALRVAPSENGELEYAFRYTPVRDDSTRSAREYCGPHRLGQPVQRNCAYFSADMRGRIDASRENLRLTALEAQLLAPDENGTLRAMSLTAREDIMLPILADGVFATRFDDIAAGTLEYRRLDTEGHEYVIELQARKNAELIATVMESSSGGTTSASKVMHWHQYFAQPHYDPVK